MESPKGQYESTANLDIRIALHQRYSINPQPFGLWVMSQYRFQPGFHILEAGCGTGYMWRDNPQVLPEGAFLELTDLSSAMVDAARENTRPLPNVSCSLADIQQLPFPADRFDAVIANMMLYHVPDLSMALREVRRVLKKGGRFYCATYGVHGIMEFVNDTLRDLGIRGIIGDAFTLQNGAELLLPWFSSVTRLDREDGLSITDVEDFVEYVFSLGSLAGLEHCSREPVRQAFLKKVKNGILYVPKEYGMFICEN